MSEEKVNKVAPSTLASNNHANMARLKKIIKQQKIEIDGLKEQLGEKPNVSEPIITQVDDAPTDSEPTNEDMVDAGFTPEVVENSEETNVETENATIEGGESEPTASEALSNS